MRFTPWVLCILVLLLPALVACGSSGDDDDDDDGSSPFGDGGSQATKSGKRSDVKLPNIKAATYGSGKAHIEISGDKTQKIDLEGNGIAQDGFGLFTYVGSDGSIQISVSSTSGESPGGFGLTTTEVATGGEWGKECTVTMEQTGAEAKGEFSCDTLDALQPGSAKTHRVKVKGTFSAGP